ncbi:serine hydroxymethyltransferase [Alicycliphilus sp. B1]|nr:serine hydroxymethyltransferase [Alicycliphilus sp. B1]
MLKRPALEFQRGGCSTLASVWITFQRHAPPAQVILQREQHKRAAVARAAAAQFVGREPHGAHDAVVERTPGVVRAHAAGEGDAQVGDVVARARAPEAVQVHAHQGRGLEVVGGFLEHLAHAGIDGRFARVQVARGIVQPQPVRRVLLDEQETPLALDDGGHGDVGFPAVWHGGDYRQRV